MQKAHSSSNNNYWKDYPLTDTPIIAATLNRIETDIDVIDDRVVAFDTSKANQSDLLTCLSGITYNDQTGVFTFTFKNGNTVTVDLNIEKIPVSFSMDANGVITMTTTDGTTYTADVSSLIKTYSFTDSSMIDFTVTTDSSGNKTVTASIIDGSITAQKLNPNFLADCQAQVTAATGQAETSEAWAKGTKSGTPVESGDAQYHNNSKYYSETSQSNSEDSEAWAKGTRNGTPVGSTDPAYNNNSKYYKDQAASMVGSVVSSFNGRQGTVVSANGDYSQDQIGVPTGSSNGQIPTVRTVDGVQKFVMETPAAGVTRLQSLDMVGKTTTFNADGSITITAEDYVENVTFNADGSITDAITINNVTTTKTITFSGSQITEVIS